MLIIGHRNHEKRRYLPIILSLATIAIFFTFATPARAKKEGNKIEFYSVRKQAPEFIHYYKSISLTKEEDAIKIDAL